MTDNTDNTDGDMSLQDRLRDAMPDMPEERMSDPPGDDDINMSVAEQEQITEAFNEFIHSLYDLGFTPNEVEIILHGFDHRLNASRYDPHEYDRIALTLELRRTIETWRDEHDDTVPLHEIATVIETLGRHYRTKARKNTYRNTDNND